jgi:GH35 family endo-1,4-beta-xylanase
VKRFASSALLCLILVPPAWALNGDALALRSDGTDLGASWRLDNNSYVGTYVNLLNPGPVTVSVNANGTSAGGVDPHMNISIDDTKVGWDVGASATSYDHTFYLPAGTHFIRTEFNNDGGTARSLTVNSLDVSGATINNANNDANAKAAASEYVQYYRKGDASVHILPQIALPGTQVHVKLKRHDFNFGTTVPNNFTDTLLINNPAPGSDAANFQQALVDNHFNSLAAENGAKWASNEGTRDVLTANAVNPNGGPNIPYMDRVSDYAQAHNMRYRQHNLIWGPNAQTGANNQQPSWAFSMTNDPNGIDLATNNPNSVALRDEISERIQYYAKDRAQRFYQIDAYNESYHTGSNYTNTGNTYWGLYGASGVASIYKEVKDAIAAGGGKADVFVNEYSVLQNQGGDAYANWYMRHIESIQNAGKALYGQNENVVTGIGFQYYASTSLSAHSPSRIYDVMQNLAVQGLPMALTEWGVTGTDNATNEANAATILEDTARLVFGMPGATGMTLWNLRNVSGVFAPVGTLYDTNWAIRDTGTRWQSLMNEWSTDLMPTVNADGSINFNGFYGDYDVTVGNKTYSLSLTKGQSAYSLVSLPGDYNGNGVVDAADYTVWRDTFGSSADLRADGNGNGMIDSGDYDTWVSKFGNVYSGGNGAAAAVPEPTTLAMLLIGCVGLAAYHRRHASRDSGPSVGDGSIVR